MPNEHTVTKEHMDALKALSETNIQISNAKNALFKLQEDETTYLTEREQKALRRIQAALENSSDLIQQTKDNYAEVHDLLKSATELATFIIEAQGNFKQLLADFEERNTIWEADIAKQEERLAELKKQSIADAALIANEKKNIAKEHVKIAHEKQKIDDAWGEIKREINRLKDRKQ
jgi:hypothetical protein